MSQLAVSYVNAKAAMTKVGLPVSAGANWTNVDVASWAAFLLDNSYYSGGYAADKYKTAYGFVFPGEMPQVVKDSVGARTYTGTLAMAPLSGAHALPVTMTLTETNDNGASFLWDFGDGTALVTTTVPTANHTYANAGTFSAKCTPVVHGVKETQITATAPTVVS